MPQWDGFSDSIGEIYALKRQDMADYAKELLVKVSRYVLPIMKKHRYRVHKLVEFLPKNECLLGVNVNHGMKISLRLRKTSNPKVFLPFETILGTMLHELCHNTFGPHDEKFFKLLGELTEEMEDLMAKGFTGDPFIGTGSTLGGGVMSTPFRSSDIISAPAQKKRPGIGRGRKLGSVGPRKPLAVESVRNLVRAAAERRRQADLECKIAQKESDLAQDEQTEVIDLTLDDKEKPRTTEYIEDLTCDARLPNTEKARPPSNIKKRQRVESEEIIYILD